jgi:hypothetical protein
MDCLRWSQRCGWPKKCPDYPGIYITGARITQRLLHLLSKKLVKLDCILLATNRSSLTPSAVVPALSRGRTDLPSCLWNSCTVTCRRRRQHGFYKIFCNTFRRLTSQTYKSRSAAFNGLNLCKIPFNVRDNRSWLYSVTCRRRIMLNQHMGWKSHEDFFAYYGEGP